MKAGRSKQKYLSESVDDFHVSAEATVTDGYSTNAVQKLPGHVLNGFAHWLKCRALLAIGAMWMAPSITTKVANTG